MWKMCSMSAKRQLWNVPELCQSGKGKADLCPPKMRCTQEKSQSWKGTLSPLTKIIIIIIIII